MMTVFRHFPKFHSAVFAIGAAALLSGCTTTQYSQPCSVQEAGRLSRHVAPTKTALDRNQTRLARIRSDIARERCTGNLFSPATKSAKCEHLKVQEQRLASENKTLSERLAELNAAIAGRPHAGQHVKSCSASWLPKRSAQKTTAHKKAAKAHKAVAKRAGHAAKPAGDAQTGLPVEDYVVPAYSSSQSVMPEPVGYTSHPTPVSHAPGHVAPVKATQPSERSYSDSGKVRVIGSSFFPDQSKPADPQAPDHAPAP